MSTATLVSARPKTHLFKACQRCHGDLLVDRGNEADWAPGTVEYRCVQCGRTAVLRMMAASGPRRAEEGVVA